MNEKEGRSDEGGEGSASVTSRALAGSAVWDPALDLPPVNHQVLWAETTSLMLSPKHQFLENILRAGLPRNTEVEDREASARIQTKSSSWVWTPWLTLGLSMWTLASTLPFNSTQEDWHGQLSQTPLYFCVFELLSKDCRQELRGASLMAAGRVESGGRHGACSQNKDPAWTGNDASPSRSFSVWVNNRVPH